MRAAFLCVLLLAAGRAWGQPVAAVYVSAPQVRMTSGDTAQLTAVARDASGNVIANAAFQWSSNNSAIVNVDSSGNVTTGDLGFADITAASGGRQGILRIQVLPARIEVSPSNLDLPFGGQQQYSAVVYNVRNEPMTNVNLTWRALAAGGAFDSATVPITSTGMLTAKTLGYYVVRASVVYPQAPDQLEREFDGSTSLRVVPKDYALRILVSSDLGFPSFHMRGKRGPISVNDAGQVAFSASLDGLNGGLMVWKNSPVSVLAAAGTQGVMPGTVFYDFDNPSIDNQGNVLAVASMIGSGPSLVMADASGLQLLAPDRSQADVVLDVSSISTNRFSLSDNGDAVLRGSFHYDASTVNYSGLLRFSFGRLALEVSSHDPLPGLNGTVSFDDQYGVDAQGVLYFSASAGSGRAVYRKDIARDPVKVIATGDKLAGLGVIQLPQIAVAGTDLIVRATLADGSQVLARYAGGSAAAPKVMNSSPGYIGQIYGANSKGGVVWLGDGGAGYGLYLWTGTDDPPRLVLARYAPSPIGEPVADFYSAAVDAAGNVYASVRGADTAWMLIRLGASPVVIAADGSPVNIPANFDLYSQPVPGGRTGPLHVLAGGSQPSIFRLDAQGPQPVLLVGDRLPGGSNYTGNFFPRKSPSGDLYVTTDNGVYRLSSGGQSTIASFPYSFPDGVRLFAPFNVAVNDRNQAVMTGGTDSSHQRVALFDGKSLRTIAYLGNPPFQTPSPAGGGFIGQNDVAINDAGLVMLNASVSGGPNGLFLYDGTGWQTVCPLLSCKLDNETISGIGTLRVSNGRFCAVFSTTIGNQRLDCWENGSWTNILRRGDFTSDGTEVTFISNAFDINQRGDVAVQVNTGLSSVNVFLKNANGFSTVQSAVFPTADGSYLLSIYAVDLRDDRRLFLIAQDDWGRMAAYEATPQF